MVRAGICGLARVAYLSLLFTIFNRVLIVKSIRSTGIGSICGPGCIAGNMYVYYCYLPSLIGC